MAVDLHTCGDSSLPYDLNHSNNISINPHYLTPKDFESHTAPHPRSDEEQRMKKDKEDHLVAELTRQMQMAHFMLQDNDKIDFSSIASHNLVLLSRLTQEKIMSLKQKLGVHGEKNHGHMISQQQFQFEKKGNKVRFSDGRRVRQQQRPGPPHQQARLEITKALSTGSFCSRGTSFCGTSNGTGVFLPRGTTTPPLESSSRRSGSGKGCPTVLIPARVVQALQLHFDQIASTSGPKPPAFPPLHDVLVSNRDGMYSYSLEKRQSRKKPSHIQNEMILPPEWTY